ncbi:MAG: isochorismatase [Nitrospiraceae bacterium]|nr:MAG: isochorismatase [Nitrospiraceae bacterium]
MKLHRELPVPSFFNPDKVCEVWKVPYQQRAEEAEQWALRHKLSPAGKDSCKICLTLVDVQNTFCIPGFDLFVGGRSGAGAVDDNRRLCEFIYRNLGVITRICPTMDTHRAMQIFHSVFLVDEQGKHPVPFTLVSEEDILQGRWKFNTELCDSLRISPEYGQRYVLHYVQSLKKGGKYDLTIWPYHAMLGGIGHALVSSVEEAIFFHTIARHAQPDYQIKGSNPFTEHYSVIGPEVLKGPEGETIAEKNVYFDGILQSFDAVVVAGQAKSHCVAWTIDDLLSGMGDEKRKAAEKIYLLEDCTSAVVVPGVIDYTGEADEAFKKFADAGMHIVRSTDPVTAWPGMNNTQEARGNRR